MFSIYIHVPWCQKKCPYCDFYSVGGAFDPERWIESTRKTLYYFHQITGHLTVSTVYFGGGTPSLLPAYAIHRILTSIRNQWNFDAAAEITMEANPSSLEVAAFSDLHDAGINRLSLGLQSLREDQLLFLGRPYRRQEAETALERAFEFFPRLSADFIYGLPSQTPRQWAEDLAGYLDYPLEHVSLYELTIESGTPFYKRGLRPVREDLAREFYETTQAVTKQKGFTAYEISNYAREDKEKGSSAHWSRHNMAYWTSQQWIGVGPSAAGRLDLPEGRCAFLMAPSILLYDQLAEENGHIHVQKCLDREVLSPQSHGREIVLMGLRLREGLPLAALEAKTALPAAAIFDVRQRQRLEDEGLLEKSTTHLRTSPQGALLLDYVTESLLCG